MGQLVDEVKKYSRIALDTNIFIYLLERHPNYGEEVKEVNYRPFPPR
ncbi:hypothetical protein H0A61_01151 [Koleobacter methoxysyntrophicus]|uniref:PIN domain-containing protein n=1 Tax=Koleobacter methoxysyntrophicus TaxID=2751313 RepID=A0A8A0RNM2_9FIRM|nr:hypothetical protein [Koleobacter methoxysyntrophicus]QSQ08806.1 hypothetical protein H0A61_01151 [Koleobacter methoxysyntrophicus]